MAIKKEDFKQQAEELERAYQYMESIAVILASPMNQNEAILSIQREIESFYNQDIYVK